MELGRKTIWHEQPSPHRESEWSPWNDMYKLQIRYRLVLNVGPHSLLVNFRAFFSCSGYVMGMIVWIVRDVESDVLVLWFDGIKTNIDGKYCYINRSLEHRFIRPKVREILLSLMLLLLFQLYTIKRLTTCKNKTNKKLTKTTIEKVLNVCKYVTRVDPNCSVWVSL